MPPLPEPLGPDTVAPDPIAQFRRWFDEARAAGVAQPEAMTLATATPAGEVSARTVLLRGLDEDGFTFFTNLGSAKGAQLTANPRGALVFHWREQERQVRVVGPVHRVADDDAVRYWDSRPRGHRLSAWASPQSEVVAPDTLPARVAEVGAARDDLPLGNPDVGPARRRPRAVDDGAALQQQVERHAGSDATASATRVPAKKSGFTPV